MLDPDWSSEEPPTQFFDWPQNADVDVVPTIATERKLRKAPITYELRTQRNIKPGRYYLEFYFVYNDGKGWKTSTKKVEFTVRNFLERHAVWIGKMALFATGASIAKTFAWPFLKSVIAYWWPTAFAWIAYFG